VSAGIDAFDVLARRELAAWRGLPADTTLDDVRARFGEPEEGLGRGRLGAHSRDFVFVRADGYGEPLRAWLDEDDRFLAIDVEYPEAGDLPAALGTPEARRDFPWAGLELAGGELVFPRRGITVYVNPETGEVLRVNLFAAGTLGDYDATARLALAPHRRRPARAPRDDW
jgi:hypothetical protein